jgi:aspartyl-tRNA synthetase
MQTTLRSHTCGELRTTHIGQTVRLMGWVQTVRDLGKFVFVDLRDRYGLTQVVVRAEHSQALYETARKLGREFVIQLEGTVHARESVNPAMPTGEIEVVPSSLTVESVSAVPPFLIADETDGLEETRLVYRYLDLRRPQMQQRLLLRAAFVREVRAYLDALSFCEVETPFFIKSTPEGARDFIVPSRMHKGSFYALPQSPQLLKQLLMVAGMDRYYQVVKCFRDEDFRGDRQPEFTQIDCEMAFVTQEDVLTTFEGMIRHVFEKVLSVNLPELPRMTYQEAMTRYGSDKPDLRFDLPLQELNAAFTDTQFPPFAEAVQNEGLIIGIVAPNLGGYTRKQLDELTDYVKAPQRGGKGLFYLRQQADGLWKSSADKFFTQEALAALAAATGTGANDLLLVVSDTRPSRARKLGGELRLELARRENLVQQGAWDVRWIVDFPLFEKDEETGALFPAHHPFVMPHPEDWHLLDTPNADLSRVRALCYDMVINGSEVCSGSVRIHRADIQAKIFALLGLTEQEKEEKFGFLLKAFEYGAPPHAGCAFGLDRIVMLASGGETIRDVIAFPKNSAGRDMMLDAPSPVAPEALKDVHIKIL